MALDLSIGMAAADHGLPAAGNAPREADEARRYSRLDEPSLPRSVPQVAVGIQGNPCGTISTRPLYIAL